MRARTIASVLASIFVVSMTPWARAQGAAKGEAVRVVYRAPDACPDQHAFEAELEQHLGPATVARLGELARTLTIVIDGKPGAFHAEVELVDREGRPTSRELTAPECGQAMRAIALVAALAARSQAERDAEAARASDASPSAKPGANAPAPTARTNEAPSASETRERPSRDRAAKSPPEDAALEREVSLGVTLATGVGPGAAAGLALGGRLGMAGDMGRSFALFALGNDTFRRNLAAADARFRLLRGRLELCPFEPLLTRSVRLSPCPGFEVGSQTGESYVDGERVSKSNPESRLWLAASLALRLRFRFGSLGVALGPELVVPITKNRFVLSQPERPLFDVPGVAVGAGAAFGFVW